MYAECIDIINRNERLVHEGRFLDAKVLTVVGDEQELLTISRGRVSVQQGPFVMPSSDFSIVADQRAWSEFLEPDPRPGKNDLFALLRGGHMQIHGDIHPFFANLQYFKDVLATPRYVRSTS